MAATSATPAAAEPRYAWVVVWACFVALAVIFGVAYSFAAFFAPLQAAFGAQRADVSLVFGVSGLIYFVLGAAAGMLSDRIGPRAVTSAGMAFIALGLIAASFAPALSIVTLAYGVLVGIGVALVYAPAIGCVQPWFTRRRGLAAGLASAGIGAGTLAVPMLAAAAIEAWQWRDALRALAAGVLVLGLGATLLLRPAPAARGGGATAGVPLAQALRSRRFGWLYASCLVAAPSMFIPFAHVSAAARDVGVDEVRAVGLVGFIGVGSLCGRFAIGALADRIGRPLTLVLMQLSLGAGYVVWALADGYAAMAAFALWMGLSYGGIVSLLPALAMDFWGARAVASIIGTLYTGAALGNLAGPWLAGWVFDRTGSYAAVVWGCVALQLAAAWASRRAVAAA